MANFAPSLQFAQRWLATPQALRDAFHQEFLDIIELLRGQQDAQNFQFNTPDLDATIADLLRNHAQQATPAKLLHSIDSVTVDLAESTPAHAINSTDLNTLEANITQKLSAQLDDFLLSHTTQLSEELQQWIKNAIKNELAQYQNKP